MKLPFGSVLCFSPTHVGDGHVQRSGHYDIIYRLLLDVNIAGCRYKTQQVAMNRFKSLRVVISHDELFQVVSSHDKSPLVAPSFYQSLQVVTRFWCGRCCCCYETNATFADVSDVGHVFVAFSPVPVCNPLTMFVTRPTCSIFGMLLLLRYVYCQ